MNSAERFAAAPVPIPSSKVNLMKIVYIERLDEPYPPIDFFVAESEEIRGIWEEHLKTSPLSDPRYRDDKRPPVMMLDQAKLAYDVADGECVLFVDKITKDVIGFVVQELVGDEELVANFNGSVFDHLNKAEKMRAEDPGRMTSVGYSSGQRSGRAFTWGKNLKKKSIDVEEHSYKMSCFFAHIWNLALPYLPKEVVDDYNAASEKLGGMAMDAGGWEKGKENKLLRYSIPRGGKIIEYEISQLAPPSGSCAKNYCRFTHNEKNLNKYAISYTTSRSVGVEAGGNFYITSYGIRVPGRADQLVGWRGEDYHGTTLAQCEPLDTNPKFNQSGLAFILSSELAGAYEISLKKRRAVDNFEDEVETEDGHTGPIMLDDSTVEAKKRATMSVIRRKPGTGELQYTKEVSQTFKLPGSHAYEKMTKKEILAELEKRVGLGKDLDFKQWYSKPALTAALLRDDGVEVEVEKAQRKKRKME